MRQQRRRRALALGARDAERVRDDAIGTRMLLTASVPLVPAMLVQRYIVRGLSLGAVKG